MPADQSCQWETIGGHSRIVTYTRVLVERSIDGRPPASSELMVRTLGGTVGRIGQVVPGEALLRRGMRAAVFVEDVSPGLFVVSGMAQGHYAIQPDEQGVPRLLANGEHLLNIGAEAAVRRLHGRTVPEVEQIVLTERTRNAK